MHRGAALTHDRVTVITRARDVPHRRVFAGGGSLCA